MAATELREAAEVFGRHATLVLDSLHADLSGPAAGAQLVGADAERLALGEDLARAVRDYFKDEPEAAFDGDLQLWSMAGGVLGLAEIGRDADLLAMEAEFRALDAAHIAASAGQEEAEDGAEHLTVAFQRNAVLRRVREARATSLVGLGVKARVAANTASEPDLREALRRLALDDVTGRLLYSLAADVLDLTGAPARG